MEFIVLPGVLNFRTWLNGVPAFELSKMFLICVRLGNSFVYLFINRKHYWKFS